MAAAAERIAEYTEASIHAEASAVYGWRFERFREAGCTWAQAEHLALTGADWHAYAALRAAGATPVQAYRVLR